MKKQQYIYSLNYDQHESALCKLESKHIFNQEDKDKLIFSDIKINPSISAFIKKRLDVVSFSENYKHLISEIKKEKIHTEGFKVEYVVFDGDTTEYAERLKKLKDIGYSIEGNPDYYNPSTTYALCCYKGIWYFGILIKNSFDWYKHKQKPHSYSNSLPINIAKTLVNIASKANKEKKLLDACCGVGTILLEACFAGNNIEGCDINWKVCRASRANLAHFDYTANVYRSDVKDIDKSYDAAIVDLPYNLLSSVTENDVLHILASTAAITDRLIIVSTSDITKLIHEIGFNIVDNCSIGKRGKTHFARKVWVCEKKF